MDRITRALPTVGLTPVGIPVGAPDPVGGAAPAAGAAPAVEAAPGTAMNWKAADVNLDAVKVPTELAWQISDKPIAGRTFTTWGDPHEISGDGLKFDNMERGEFVKLMSASGDFVLQTRQDPWVKNTAATVNTMAAVQLGNDLVIFDLSTNELTINGTPVPHTPGSDYALPGGGSVRVAEDGTIAMTSEKGDKVNVLMRDSYIDVTGEVAASRKDGEIRGSLGTFDNDTSTTNDLMGRTGNKPMGTPANAKELKAFLDEWRVKPGERLAERALDMKFFNQMLDTDGDGKVAGQELTAHYSEHYDLNGDGKLTRAEFVAAWAAKRNGFSGSSTPTEGARKEVADADFNKDGKTTVAEFFGGQRHWDIFASLKRADEEDAEAAQREQDIRRRQVTDRRPPAK